MSEAAPERRTPPPSSPARSSSGNDFFSKKYGPLPGWGWAVLAGGVAVAYLLYRKYKAAQDAAAQQSNQSYTASGIDYGPQLATIQEEIQNLQAGDHDKDVDANGNVTVPDVVGLTDTAGDAKIMAAGLKVKDVNEKAGGSGGGTKITAQSPAGGTKVKPGSTVSVTLGSGSSVKKPSSQPRKPSGPPAKKPPARKPPAKKGDG